MGKKNVNQKNKIQIPIQYRTMNYLFQISNQLSQLNNNNNNNNIDSKKSGNCDDKSKSKSNKNNDNELIRHYCKTMKKISTKSTLRM
jgi:RNase P subunit RPR2